MSLLNCLSQRTVSQFELRDESEKDIVGFNLLFAIVITNLTQDFEFTQNEQLISTLQTNLNQMHKMPFGKFYPARIWTSNILATFIYFH